jgi:hypothetical protein
MAPITYKRNYQHSIKYHAESAEQLWDNACASPSYQHAVEFLMEGVRSFLYFDVDIRLPFDVDKEMFISMDSSCLETAKLVINSVIDSPIKSICTSSCYDYIEGKTKTRISKISYHIVCNVSVSRDEAKGCAERCNSYLSRIIRYDNSKLFMSNCFDLNVYHKVQSWRLVSQIKVGDPITKKKNILFGTFADSIIQHFEEPEIVPIASKFKILMNVVHVDPSDKFSFLWRAFEDNSKRSVLKVKMHDYSSWTQLAMYFCYCIQKDNNLENEARELFIKCSMLDEEKFDLYLCEKKITDHIGKVRNDSENLIKSWFNNVSDLWCDIGEYSPIVDQLLCEIIGEPEPVLFVPYNFIPLTETQYVVLQYASTVKLQKFWRQQITSCQHLSKIKILLCNKKDQPILDIYSELCMELLENVDRVHLPFDFGSGDEDRQVLMYFAEFCGIDVSDAQLDQLCSFSPKDDDIAKVAKETAMIINELEPTLEQDLKLVCSFHYRNGDSEFHPLPKMGQREGGPFEYVLKLSREPLLWKTRIPYKQQLGYIWDIAGDDLQYFRFVLCKYSDLFIAEKFFGFISKAYDDRQAARIIYDFYPFWTVSPSQDLYVYDYSAGLWSMDSSIHQKIIFLCASFLYCSSYSYGGLVEATKKAIKGLQSLQFSKEYDFKNLQQTSIGKLLFPNGYWDGFKNKFYGCRSLPDRSLVFCYPEVFFFARIPDNYINIWDEGSKLEIADMKNKLFYSMHEKHIAEYHIESLSCALLGVKHKGFYVHIGDTNSGKSTEKSMIEATFGDYVGTGNTDDFAVIKDDKREASISNSFAYYNWMKRLLLYSEKSERKLSVEMLKTHASGQEDQVSTRIQYKPAILVNVHYTMFFYMNEAFEVTKPNDSAYIERAFFYYWNKVFMPKEKITDPSTQIEMDPTVSEWKNSSVRRQMFCAIILDGFRDFVSRGCKRLAVPLEIKQSTQEEVGSVETTKELMEKILYGFVLDGNPEVVMYRESMIEKCKELNICPKRVGMKLNYIMKTLGQKSIYPVQRRINGVKQNCWVGIHVRNSSAIKEGDYLTDFEQWQILMKTHNGILGHEIKRILQEVAFSYNRLNITEDEAKMIEEYGSAYQLRIYEERRNAKRARHQL